MPKQEGYEKLPEKAVGGDKTPRVTPVDVGHASGGEVNWLNISGDEDAEKKR